MVNEAREALRALVLNKDIDIGEYQIYSESAGLHAAIGQYGKGLLIVVEKNFEIRLLDDYADASLLRALVSELTSILGRGADGAKPWGGPLTWLALKAALTTGGNDAP